MRSATPGISMCCDGRARLPAGPANGAHGVDGAAGPRTQGRLPTAECLPPNRSRPAPRLPGETAFAAAIGCHDVRLRVRARSPGTAPVVLLLAPMLLAIVSPDVGRGQDLAAGFAAADITPQLHPDRPVWLAGYGHNRAARGVHDPLYARALVLRSRDEKLAVACVDLIGLQRAEVLRIRSALPDYAYVLVCSTHNHQGPDVIGLWGGTPFSSGVDAAYLQRVVEQVVAAIRQAEQRLVPVRARYGTAEDESLLGDSRLPKVYDGVLRTVRFVTGNADQTAGLLVQWNCHPEALGPRNTMITADFVATTVARLQRDYAAPVVYVSGALGGLMAPPDGRFRADNGRLLREGEFEFAAAYGDAVARLAQRAVQRDEPLRLTPWSIAPRQVAVPLHNGVYQLARALGVLQRGGCVWTGDPDVTGPEVHQVADIAKLAVVTEVAYLQLGQLHVACIPGELYPELVYGRFQEPADPAADYPDAPLEPHVARLVPDPQRMLIVGLANDEIGYLIPKRQWDVEPPFCYGRLRPQYGEINSVGPEAAGIILHALGRCVGDAAARRADPPR